MSAIEPPFPTGIGFPIKEIGKAAPIRKPIPSVNVRNRENGAKNEILTEVVWVMAMEVTSRARFMYSRTGFDHIHDCRGMFGVLMYRVRRPPCQTGYSE